MFYGVEVWRSRCRGELLRVSVGREVWRESCVGVVRWRAGIAEVLRVDARKAVEVGVEL